MYSFGVVGDKDEMITFWGQKVKRQGHGETKYGQKGTLGILKVTSSKVRDTDNLSGEGMMLWRRGPTSFVITFSTIVFSGENVVLTAVVTETL